MPRCRTCQAGAVPTGLLPSRAELHRAWHIPWARLAARLART